MRRAITGFLALFLSVTGCEPAYRAAPPPATTANTPARWTPSGPSVQSMQLLTASVGWARTDRALVMTRDGGDHWTDITPPGTVDYLSGVWFLDPLHGWAAVAPKKPRFDRRNLVRVLRTLDGGSHWDGISLSVFPALNGSYGPAYFFFLDPAHGWLSLDLGNNTAGTAASLFFTADGGASWAERSVPLNDPVRFSTPLDGWTAGGPDGDRLYFTRDGGTSWQARSLGAMSACGGTQRFLGVPSMQSIADGVIAATMSSEAAGGIVFYLTRDAARTWRPTTPLCPSRAIGQGAASPTDVVSANVWVAAFTDGSGLFVTQDAGSSWKRVTLRTAGVTAIDYVDEDVGWWLVETGGCLHFKSDCWSASGLFRARGDRVELLDPTPASSRPSYPPCRPDQFELVLQMEGTGGGAVPTVQVRHVGSVPCGFHANLMLAIEDRFGRLLDVRGNPSSTALDGDLPHDHLAASWWWRNWCGERGDLRYAVTGADKRALEIAGAPRCEEPAAPSLMTSLPPPG